MDCTCSYCRGSGNVRCPECKGKGHKMEENYVPEFQMTMPVKVECSRCHGDKEIICPVCGGKKRIRARKKG